MLLLLLPLLRIVCLQLLRRCLQTMKTINYEIIPISISNLFFKMKNGDGHSDLQKYNQGNLYKNNIDIKIT